MYEKAESLWAREEFGRACIGDKRRTERLVEIAAGAAARPAGHITEVYRDPAMCEGAFRLMSNEEIGLDEIARAAHVACAKRSAEYPFVFVPIDTTSLNLKDWQRTKGLGVIGARFVGARGLHAMSSIAVSPDEIPLGICGQEWWARKGRARRDDKHDKRLVESKETQYWLNNMDHVSSVYAEHAPSTRPWFQIDRGGDAWPVILKALTCGHMVTVRAAYDRRLMDPEDGPRLHLREELERQPPIGCVSLDVPARAGRKARVASIMVRTCKVTLDLHDERAKKHIPATLWAVLAREESTELGGNEPIEWLLLTTYPVNTFADAQLVLKGYAQRWRVEEFHKTWKSGACRVEETQLRDKERIIKWATILASVAIRIVRITYLARNRPDLPATVEFTMAEIIAIEVTKSNGRKPPKRIPTIGQVVLWIAEIGGYTGKSSGGPPGAIVIRRGLERIQVFADFVEARMKM